MQCPRCQNVVLTELDRSGVTVDRCETCRGIWLDRGELEKLLARATAELEGAPQPVRTATLPAPHMRYGHDDHEPPSSRRGHHGHHSGQHSGHRRPRSFWHELFD